MPNIVALSRRGCVLFSTEPLLIFSSARLSCVSVSFCLCVFAGPIPLTPGKGSTRHKTNCFLLVL